MYNNMAYGDKPVEVGDVLMHKKWVNENGRPLRLEVVKPSYFGSSLPLNLTVVLREKSIHGFNSRQTEALPQTNGGMAFVPICDVKFIGRGTEESSVFTRPVKKQRFRQEDEDDE